MPNESANSTTVSSIQEESEFVARLSAATGVPACDVLKVLKTLGVDRLFDQAVAQNSGKEPTLDQAKLMFRLSRNSVVL